MEDEERPGQPKKFEDEELEALLDEDCCQTQEELAESLEVTQAAISKRLKAAEKIQKQGNWVPHELKPRDVERRFCMSEMLLEDHKKKSFLHRIVTGDEKWILYDNPKRKKSYVIQPLTALKSASPQGLGDWHQTQLSAALSDITNEKDNENSIGCFRLKRTSGSEFNA